MHLIAELDMGCTTETTRNSLKQSILMVIFVVALVSDNAQASDASHCIEVAPVENKLMNRMDMALKNTCPEKVYVRWCFVDGSKDGCGGERYFNRSRTIDANDYHTSKYGLPTGPAIRHVACFGKFPYVFKTEAATPNYTCDPVVRCDDSSELYIFKRVTKLETEKTSVYSASDGEVTHTFRIEKSEFSDHSRDPDKTMALFAKLRVCGAIDEPDFSSKVRNGAIHYINNKLQYYRDVCAHASEKAWYCEYMNEPAPKPTSSWGVQG